MKSFNFCFDNKIKIEMSNSIKFSSGSYHLKTRRHTMIYNMTPTSTDDGGGDKVNILEFCWSHKIKTLPVKLEVGDGKKRYLTGEEGRFEDGRFNSKMTDFAKTSFTECKALTEIYADETDWIAIDTTDIHQLDIDDPKWEYDLEATALLIDENERVPYFLSLTKKCPHYFLKTKDKATKNCWQTSKVPLPYSHDVLTGQWSFAKRDEVVCDHTWNIPVKDLPPRETNEKAVVEVIDRKEKEKEKELKVENTLKKDEKTLKKDEKSLKDVKGAEVTKDDGDNALLQKVVSLIKTDPYLTNRNSWMRIVWAIRKEGGSQELAKTLSAKAPNFSLEGFQNVWTHHSRKEQDKVSMGTLKYFARQSDEAAYLRLFARKDSSASTNCTDYALAEKFFNLVGDDMIYQNGNLYLYHQKRWIVDGKCEMVKLRFVRTMVKHFTNVINELNEASEVSSSYKKAEIESLTKCINFCQRHNNVSNCIGALKGILAEKQVQVEFDVGSEQHYTLHFNNCAFDLRTKTARPREKTDYVTQILDYDFLSDADIREEVKEEVALFYKKLQPDQEQRLFTLSYLAYCLTGNTGHQVMKMNIGYSASNGKSTELKIHHIAFPIYTTKLDKRTFNVGFEKKHKEFLQLIKQPVRLAYIEELDRKQLDVDVLKDFVDGKDLCVEILYGTKEVKPHQCKIVTASNKDPNMESDEGVVRRMRVQHYESRFVEGAEDDYEDHVYGRVLNYENRFELEEYKNAYFHLLLQHIDVLKIPASAKVAFESIAADYDEFANLLEERYEITKLEEDQVAKSDLEAYFEQSRMKWTRVLSELKRMGLTYSRDQRLNGKRGVIYGLMERADSDSDNSDKN
jgi:hypothetical protein